MKNGLSIRIFEKTDGIAGDKKMLHGLSACYCETFNESWQEDWTMNQALKNISQNLLKSENRRPLLSLLLDQEKIIGFSWVILTHAENILFDDLPFGADKYEKGSALSSINKWLKLIGRKKILAYKELGILKKYRNTSSRHLASLLSLPLLKKAYSSGYKTAFQWTSASSPAFKLSLGCKCHPIYIFNNGYILFAGSTKSYIRLLEGINEKNKTIFRELRQNKKDFFCL